MEKIWHKIIENKRNDKSTVIKEKNYKQNVITIVNKMFVYYGNVGNRKTTFIVITVTSFMKRY